MNVISMEAAARSWTEPRFRIHRYPTTLIDRVQQGDGRSVTIRPVLPQDAALQRAFVAALSPATSPPGRGCAADSTRGIWRPT